MMFKLPKSVIICCKIFDKAKFNYYLVGGCVRDLLLGKTPNDYDLITDASIKQIKELFSQYKMKNFGEKHGTIMVIIEKTVLEITTYKSNVHFQKNITKRDFTINALAYHPARGIIDLYDGRNDLENKIIRGVKSPKKRFYEDPLRILRGLRFAASLGFSIEAKTATSIHKYRHLLKKVAIERIKEEFVKIIMGKNFLKVMEEYPDVIQVIFPEVFQVISEEEYHNNLKMMALSNTLKLSLLFYSTSINEEKLKIIESGLKRLRFAKKIIKEVLFSLRLLTSPIEVKTENIKRIIHNIGLELLIELINLKMSLKSQNDEELVKIVAIAERLLAKREVKTLKINGDDLKNLGITEGPLIGDILYLLSKEVIEGKVNNDFESLKLRVLEIMKAFL